MPTKSMETMHLPAASLGTRRSLRVVRYGSGSFGRKATLQAGLHADEPPGFLVMHHLMNLLDGADRDNRITSEIVLIPVANPIGWDQWDHETMQGRFETASGVNFNREIPDLMEGTLARVRQELGADDRENRRLIVQAALDTLEEWVPSDEGAFLKKNLLSLSLDSDIVLDLHCDEKALFHMYTGTPLWPAMEDLALQTGAALVLLAEDSGGSPYDEACSSLWWRLARELPGHSIPMACQAATLELRGFGDISHETALADAGNIYAFLQRRGFVEGDPPPLDAAPVEARPLEGVLYVKAPAPGVAVYLKEPGDRVRKGECVAHLVDPSAEGDRRVREIRSTIDGLLFSTRIARNVRTGMILAKIAGIEPLEGKGAHLLTP